MLHFPAYLLKAQAPVPGSDAEIISQFDISLKLVDGYYLAPKAGLGASYLCSSSRCIY